MFSGAEKSVWPSPESTAHEGESTPHDATSATHSCLVSHRRRGFAHLRRVAKEAPPSPQRSSGSAQQASDHAGRRWGTCSHALCRAPTFKRAGVTEHWILVVPSLAASAAGSGELVRGGTAAGTRRLEASTVCTLPNTDGGAEVSHVTGAASWSSARMQEWRRWTPEATKATAGARRTSSGARVTGRMRWAAMSSALSRRRTHFRFWSRKALKIHIDHTTACTPARRCYWVLSCPRGLGWYYERACWRLAALPTASCPFVRLFLCVHAGWRVGCCRGPPRPGGCPAAQYGDCNETARWIQLTTDVVDAF